MYDGGGSIRNGIDNDDGVLWWEDGGDGFSPFLSGNDFLLF